MTSFYRCALLCAIVSVCSVQPQQIAADDAVYPAPDATPSHLVVVRLTEEWFTSRIDRQIDEQTPVDQVILDVRVRGTARTVGQPRVELRRDPDNAALQVVLSGTTVSRTVGRKGPAIIHSRSETKFSATKQIVFTAGKGFTALPAEIQADTRTTTDKVESTRGGFIGRLVQRRAWKKIEENRPLTTSIARSIATERIRAAFERQMEDMLVQLNRSADLRETIALLRGRHNGPGYTCCSTDKYVQFAVAGGSGQAATCPPALGNFDAPVQIWVHKSLVPPRLAPAITQFRLARSSIEELIGRFGLVLPAASGLPDQQSDQQAVTAMRYQFVEDWTVLSWRDARPPVSLAQFRGSSSR